jgi:hypothetical protein
MADREEFKRYRFPGIDGDFASYEETAKACLNQREALATMMVRNSIATGHGETLEDLLSELEGYIREQGERIAALEHYEELWLGMGVKP